MYDGSGPGGLRILIAMRPAYDGLDAGGLRISIDPHMTVTCPESNLEVNADTGYS